MALTQSDMYSLAIAQGLPPDKAKVAAAIGMAESGGDPNSHNTNASTGDNSYGLWQINMLGSLGPARLVQLGIPNNDALFDPTTNAKAMRILSANGSNFKAWSTYNDGKYQQFMGNAVADNSKKPGWLDNLLHIVSPVSNASNNPVSDINSAASAVGNATIKTASWVSNSKNWIRVGFVVGGSILALGAIISMVSDTKVGGIVTGVATKGLVSKGGTKTVAPKKFEPGGAANVS